MSTSFRLARLPPLLRLSEPSRPSSILPHRERHRASQLPLATCAPLFERSLALSASSRRQITADSLFSHAKWQVLVQITPETSRPAQDRGITPSQICLDRSASIKICSVAAGHCLELSSIPPPVCIPRCARLPRPHMAGVPRAASRPALHLLPRCRHQGADLCRRRLHWTRGHVRRTAKLAIWFGAQPLGAALLIALVVAVSFPPLVGYGTCITSLVSAGAFKLMRRRNTQSSTAICGMRGS